MRMRAGLSLPPAFTLSPESRCALVSLAGERCPGSLDVHGHHASTCSFQGMFTGRHDKIRDVLLREIRKCGVLAWKEQWCPELFDERERRHARLDLVVFNGGQVSYLDVTCSHPFSGVGKPREEGRVANTALAKHDRYRTVVAGVRVTSAKLVPVAMSSYGAVGKEARAFFASLAHAGGTDAEPGVSSGQRLVALCSFLAVMYSASNAMAAFLSPDHGPRARRAQQVMDASPSSELLHEAPRPVTLVSTQNSDAEVRMSASQASLGKPE